ncbi:MAG: hypothetical protein LBT54_07165, partial [Bifidobacteriaceae bacterium]|nr:hypothetical protein [Bifidobacteriaceae bacterium]
MSTGLSAGAGASTAPLPNAAIRRRLLAIARPVIAPLGVSITLRAVALACGVALLGIGGWAVGTTAQGDGSGIGARAVIVLLVVLSLLKGLARYGEQFAGHLVAFKALALLRVFFFRALEPQAPAAVEGRSTGDLLSRVTKDVDRVEVFFAHTIAPAVTAVLVPVVSIGAFALLVDPVGAALLGVALALVGIGVPLLGTRASALAAAGLRVGRGGIAQHVTDSV